MRLNEHGLRFLSIFKAQHVALQLSMTLLINNSPKTSTAYLWTIHNTPLCCDTLADNLEQ